jgi:aspartate dehydrogenase
MSILSKRISIIGCGAIGTELAKAVDSKAIPNCSLLSIVDFNEDALKRITESLTQSKISLFSDIDKFLNSDQYLNTDIIVEAASPIAVKHITKVVLQSKKDLLIMSAGSFSDPTFLKDILLTIKEFEGKLHIPSGAIAGIDGIKSVKNYLDSVTLTTTKSSDGLRNAPYFISNDISIDSIREKKLIFSGNASDAIDNFPNNINVSSILSLIGVGFEKTIVNIYLDPFITTNKHEVIAKGSFGTIYIAVENVPSPMNPKTSFLAILSAIECLKNITHNQFHIGT